MILQQVEHHQPIGRRALARILKQTERVLRAEVELLKEQGLIEFLPIGMQLTFAGKQLLNRLFPIMLRMHGAQDRERELAERLSIHRVMILPGDSSQDRNVQREIGRMAAQYLIDQLREHERIAVTGGSTIAAIAEMLQSDQAFPDVTFLPARGGLGEQVHNQANLIVAEMASKLDANYLLLQVPDHLSKEAYHSLIEEAYIRERLELIRSATLVFHGVGNALEMAKKRNATEEVVQIIKEKHAISEAFGAYFDQNGEMVYQMHTIGLRPEDVKGTHAVAVAGGGNKALAIASLAKAGIFQVLITDEGSANEILKEGY